MQKKYRFLIGILALAVLVTALQSDYKEDNHRKEGMVEILMRAMEDEIGQKIVPLVQYSEAGTAMELIGYRLNAIVPLYEYICGDLPDDRVDLEESNEGKNTVVEKKTGSYVKKEENRQYTETKENIAAEIQTESAQEDRTRDLEALERIRQLRESKAQEKAEKSGYEDSPENNFVPHNQRLAISLEPYRNYEVFMKEFYTVDSGTWAGKELMNAEKFVAKDFTIEKEGTAPQILIFHTHSREGYIDTEDTGIGVVEVGEYLAQVLRETYGYQVLHITEAYDEPGIDQAYGRALTGITKVLKENPGIQVVIDLHRDEVEEAYHLATDLDGRTTAQFMFFNGLSYSKDKGKISYLYNENLEANLAFSFQMKLMADEYYPGLTRKNYLKTYRYNMHLMERYLLVELGAQNNTGEEALNACEPLAHILSLVLDK